MNTPTTSEVMLIASEHPSIKERLNNGWAMSGFYPYVDEDGQTLYYRIRLDPPPNSNKPKWIRPFYFDGNTWQLKEPKCSGGKPLYLLPNIVNTIETVYIVEGEKCADALTKLGITSTTSGGASSANLADWSILKGRNIIIWRDNDETGLRYCDEVSKQLRRLQCNIKYIDIDNLNLPEKGDCVDWLTAHPNASKDDIEALPLIEPQLAESKPLSYPVELLPDIVKNAVLEYQAYGQQPLSLVTCSALANMSLACQGLANVARDSQLISPISLNFVVIAESGERKTASDNHHRKATKNWEEQKKAELAPQIKESKSQHSIWQARRKSLLSKIEKAETKKNQQDINKEELERRLIDLEQQEPTIIVEPNLYYEEITTEALGYNLAVGWPSTSLWSDEAGVIIGGHGMKQENATKFTSLLNRLWDGNSHRVKRRSGDNFVIEGRRLTCSLMMQPTIFEQLVNRSDGVSRGNGFLARCLIIQPISTMGDRPYKDPPCKMPKATIFCNRIEKLLNEPLPLDEKQRLIPKTLQLDTEAKEFWVEFHDDVEGELKASGEFHDIKDFAAKVPENAVRLAGILHIFCCKPGNLIDLETMRRAIGILSWHLQETKRLLGSFSMSQDEQDAQILIDWLRDQGNKYKVTDILKFGPNCLRKKDRRDAAIQSLIESNLVRFENHNGINYVAVNDAGDKDAV